MKLNYRNFENPDLRSNPTVINEVICGLILEKYINTTCELVVGDKPDKNLPIFIRLTRNLATKSLIAKLSRIFIIEIISKSFRN